MSSQNNICDSRDSHTASQAANYTRSVWVSYSGKDADLVHALTRYVDQQGQTEPTPFKMLTYLRETDDKPAQETADGSNRQSLKLHSSTLPRQRCSIHLRL